MIHRKTLLAASIALSITSLTTQASLTAGISDGKSVVYDDVTNITWTDDANLLGTLESQYGYDTIVNDIISNSPIYDTSNYTSFAYSYSSQYVVSIADFSSDYYGRVSWFEAQAFVSYLNSINYANSNQWTLPSAGGSPRADYNVNSGQFGQLFYAELGGSALHNMPIGSTFINAQNYVYFYKNELAQDPKNAWLFSTGNGNQNNSDKNFPRFAWAVTPGQVAAVPVPAAAWLFGSAMLGFASLKRRSLKA